MSRNNSERSADRDGPDRRHDGASPRHKRKAQGGELPELQIPGLRGFGPAGQHRLDTVEQTVAEEVEDRQRAQRAQSEPGDTEPERFPP